MRCRSGGGVWEWSPSRPAEAWQIESHQSFASIEDLDKAVGPVAPAQADPLALSSTLIASSTGRAGAIGPTRRSDVPAGALFPYHHLPSPPDAENDLGELVKLRRMGSDSVNLDRPDLAYQVISGAPPELLSSLPARVAQDHGRGCS